MSRGTLDPASGFLSSLTGLSPSLAGFPKTILLHSKLSSCGPNPPVLARTFGLFRVRSPLLPESHVVFFSSGYLDVSVHRVPFLTLCVGVRMTEGFSAGFPHSEIFGSKDICSSPKLFAAYHVFHRLLVPRHPPYALSYMTKRLSQPSSTGTLFRECLHSWGWIRVMGDLRSKSHRKHLSMFEMRLLVSCFFPLLPDSTPI